jgi:hypothetical protein
LKKITNKIASPSLIRFSLKPVYDTYAFCIYFDPRNYFENINEKNCLILLDKFSLDGTFDIDKIHTKDYLSGPTFFMGKLSYARIEFNLVKKLNLKDVFIPNRFAQRGYYDMILSTSQAKLEKMNWFVEWIDQDTSRKRYDNSYRNLLHLPYNSAHGFAFAKAWAVYHYDKINNTSFYDKSLELETSRDSEDFTKMLRGDIEYDELYITACYYQYQFPYYEEFNTLKDVDPAFCFQPSE